MGTVNKNPADVLRQANAGKKRAAFAAIAPRSPESPRVHQTLPAQLARPKQSVDQEETRTPSPRRKPALSPHLKGVWLALDFELPERAASPSVASHIAQWVVEPTSAEALAHGARLAVSRAVHEGESSVVFTDAGTALVALASRGDSPISIQQMAKQGLAPNMVRLEANPSDPQLLQRYFVRKKRDKTTGSVREQGAVDKVRDGTYPFVLDQSKQIIIPPTVAADGHAGAHRNLAGGLMVLFAGELTIKTVDNVQQVVSFSPKSGNYRTPMTLPVFEAQARQHPLLARAEFAPLSDVLAQLDLNKGKSST